MGWIQDPLLEVGGPVSHWIGPETLVDLTIEGRNVNALADSGSQVNTIMPTFMQQYGFPVLPLEALVNHPLNLVGLGGKCTSPLGFIILHMQVWEIAGYDEDVVFLMVSDESEFGHRVPLVIGTCTIGWIINVIWESEIDHLSTPWATARMVQLLSCWKSTAVLTLGSVGEAQSEGASGGPQEVDVDELVTVRECLLRTIAKIIEGWIKSLLGDTAHVMITLLKGGEGQPWEARPFPPGLHVLHAYTHLKNGSGKVSLMVRNMSDSHIFLKKGVPAAQVMSASPVPPTELSPEMETALGMEARPEPMLVVVRQEKLLEKLNLDGLAHWSPKNAAAARELVLAYHDVFTLESNELGCTSAIEHEICIKNSEPFKEWFWCIPPPLLEEVHMLLWEMLEAGAICPSQSLWCNVVVLVRKKDGTLCFCVDFRCLNTQTKKDSYPLPHIQEELESMVGTAYFLSMDFKSGFWQIKMAPELQQYTVFTVGNFGFYEFTRMLFGLCNAPATFQHLMQNTLGELNLMYCVIYLDDVIVFGHTEEEHLEHLRIVFERFREFSLKLKPSKCLFFQLEIVYLAHHISQQGILLSQDNVQAMEEFPMPETYLQVRAFCGLVGHYRRFIKGFANIVHPLYDMLGKEVKMDSVDLPPEA